MSTVSTIAQPQTLGACAPVRAAQHARRRAGVAAGMGHGGGPPCPVPRAGAKRKGCMQYEVCVILFALYSSH